MINKTFRRTDLAVEAHKLWREDAERTTELSGVIAHDATRFGFDVTTVKITDEEGAAELGKPCGTYVTVELDKLLRRDDDAFRLGVYALADEIEALLRSGGGDSVLVVGLGNRAITADAIGPEIVRNVMVTGAFPQELGPFRSVFALEAGVLGTTGIESARVIRAVCEEVMPDRVIVADALASRSVARLCRTVQISDTGIVPGSGIGNARAAVNRETLGVPVISVGVPTVVDIGDLVVTPKEIDGAVNDISKLVGYAINLALHRDLTVDDITMFLG
ncbi:MAG: GPR endopeptidase [Oscillospiraceae bacterium]|jgi:spore protease|nr:GPR endopeptidase [Oscillospiraceae bacterium]